MRVARRIGARFVAGAAGLLLAAAVSSCSDPVYDASTPQAALEAMHKMVADGRGDLMANMIYIEARDVAYEDGVTEASAIGDVTQKAGDMLGRLFRVAGKLREKFPGQVEKELAAGAAATTVDRPDDAQRLFGSAQLDRFLVDPFGLLNEQAARLSAQDLGDGTAAILLDGKPMLGGLGLMMREVKGSWKVEIPIAMLQQFRPETRQEWAVLASMMLSLENAFQEFEGELDGGKLHSLHQASERAGRLLFESAAIQVILYRAMKDHAGAGETKS